MTTTVHGHCDESFSAVRDAFQANFDRGLEDGASVAILINDELVVDLWGGVADPATGAPWQEDTICCLFSATKTMSALCMLTLADRGLIDMDAPVAEYWPEFSANGKDGVLVRHVLAHTAGLPGWTESVTFDDLYDTRGAAAALAEQAPWWEPGTAAGYHAVTQGYLLGELVLRVTGESLGTFFRTTFAEPLGAEYHIGTGPELDARIAPIIPPTNVLGGRSTPGSIGERALNNPVIDAAVANTERYRRIELPASNGYGNARGLARTQRVISHSGTVDGTTFLTSSGVDQIFREQWVGPDLIQEMDTRLGIGFGLNGPEVPISANPKACFWGGWGGSVVINDLDARTTFAYAMNRMGDGLDTDFRAIGLVLAWQAAAMA
jgi:CubicO group peptidase (beta-lactamase class C family)